MSQSISSKPYQILESATLSEGKYPVVSQGKCRIDGYCNAEDKALTEVPLVLFGDHTRAVKYIDFPFVVGADGTKLFRPYINSKWLYYWTCHAALIQLDSRGYGRHWILLNQLLIPLPPLYEQKRIVAKAEELFTYADTIGESSEGVARTAERIDKKILDLAIRGQLMPQDQGDEPASELLKRLEAAKRAKAGGRVSSRAASDRPAYEIDPPFDIPGSWEWVRLGTLIQIIAGVSYKKDDVTTSGVRVLRGGNIKEDARLYLHDDDVFLPPTYGDDDTSVKEGDIVVVASTGSGTVIGRPAIATETMPDVQVGAFLRIIRAVDCGVKSWLPVVFLGDYYRNHIRSKSKGTNIKNLKAEYLTELPVPLPPLAEQKRIVAKIEEVRAMTKSLTT